MSKNDKKSFPTMCPMAYLESAIMYNLGSTCSFTEPLFSQCYPETQQDIFDISGMVRISRRISAAYVSIHFGENVHPVVWHHGC